MPRHFTLWEADRLLPQIRDWMQEAVNLKAEFDEAEHAVQALAERITMMGGIVADRERASANKVRARICGT